MKLKILAIVLLAVVGLGATFVAVGGLPASAAAATQYLTSAATTGDVTSSVAATGTLASTASYGVAFGSSPHVAGATASDASGAASATWAVRTVTVQVGDAVKTGAVLATATSADLHRQVEDALRAWRVARIQLSDAEDSYDNASGTAATRQARIGLYNAQSQEASAQANLETLQAQARNATLKAPMDGVVTAVNVTVGLDAPSGDAIVIDSSGLQVTADVVESDIAQMSVGQPATVAIAAVDATLTGTVTAIAPTASSTSSGGSVVSFPVTISIQGAPATVRPGMTASITITIDSAANVLTVPAAALRGTAGAYTVLVMGADGQPTSKTVEVGLVTNTTAEVKSGLAAGDVVVTGVSTPATGTTTTTGGGFGGGFGGFGGGTGRPRNGN